MLTSLTWGLDVTVLGARCPKENLTVLLSDKWIDNKTINMMMFNLEACVHLDPELRKTSVVAMCALSAFRCILVGHTKLKSKESSPLAQPLHKALQGKEM